MARNKPTFWITPLIAMVLLAGVAMETFSRPQPEAAEPYHEKIQAIAKDMPEKIGDWVGVDEPIRRQAVEMLKPNVIYNRSFTNTKTQERVVFLLVQCKDARDIYGHYPPVCYPGSGLQQRSAEPFDRYSGDRPIRGMEYVFATEVFGSQRLTVDNFILLPNGEIVRDMSAVKKRAWDYQRRFYGAAQVQVVYSNPKLTEKERKEIFDTIVEAHMPVIDAILTGEVQ